MRSVTPGAASTSVHIPDVILRGSANSVVLELSSEIVMADIDAPEVLVLAGAREVHGSEQPSAP